MEDRSTYVSVLKDRLATFLKELEVDREKIAFLNEVIAKKEENATYIQRLLEQEGVDLRTEGLHINFGKSIADIAYEVMRGLEKREPIHYKKLSELVFQAGKTIPGKDPSANLITHIGRDARFKRTGRGLYALTDWGLKPVATARSKKRRKK